MTTVIEHPNVSYTTINGAAHYLNVHPDTIRRMIYANKLPPRQSRPRYPHTTRRTHP
ncbi:helix-turn-helix domain-containing protein [Arcanobacterium pinnipediorum]|uniref:helix-turn-helix domain-containing protein n=1 Tax=Arcanobacterium pinnipediorum TaxID=1503041 RepID=UPI00338E5B6B